MAEILSKTLIEDEKNTSIFKFIWELTIELDNTKETDDNFCLKYLISLTKFLGFFPSTENIEHPIFNLNNSSFTQEERAGDITIKGDNLTYFRSLITNKGVKIPYLNRQQLLEKIFFYYKTHHYNLDNVKSHIVIESLR